MGWDYLRITIPACFLPNQRKEASWEKRSRRLQILSSAKYPLIYGLSSTSSEAQRVSVKLAEALGASIDSTSSVCHGPTGLAMQFVGEPTCTLGEIKNRADLLIFWGCNPIVSHSRHFARYSVMPSGRFVQDGRESRKVVVVDVRLTQTARVADVFLQVKPGVIRIVSGFKGISER